MPKNRVARYVHEGGGGDAFKSSMNGMVIEIGGH